MLTELTEAPGTPCLQGTGAARGADLGEPFLNQMVGQGTGQEGRWLQRTGRVTGTQMLERRSWWRQEEDVYEGKLERAGAS